MSQPLTNETPAATGPTPNNMPGAAPAATQTADNTPPAATTPAATPAAPVTPSATPEAPPEQQPGESNLDWKERAKLWEDRAKVKGVTQEALDKAKLWDQYQESQKTEDQRRQESDAAKDLEITTLKETATRERVARDTGVPPTFLVGKSEEEMRSAAEEFKKYATPGAPQPQSSAVPASSVTSTANIEGPKQIKTRDELAHMKGPDIMKAYREGRLSELGAVPGAGDLTNLQHAKDAATQRK